MTIAQISLARSFHSTFVNKLDFMHQKFADSIQTCAVTVDRLTIRSPRFYFVWPEISRGVLIRERKSRKTITQK
jgi:hypothetical protein